MIAAVTVSVFAVPPMSRVRMPVRWWFRWRCGRPWPRRGGRGGRASGRRCRWRRSGCRRPCPRCPAPSRGPARTCSGSGAPGSGWRWRRGRGCRPARCPGRRGCRRSGWRRRPPTGPRAGARTSPPSRRPARSRSRRPGSPAATRRKTSSQRTMPYCWALLLVTLETFFRAGAGQVEGEADDPLAAVLGEQRRLDGDLAAGAAGGQVAAAEAGVLALAVLPDDDPVQVGVVGLAQRALDARAGSATGRTLAHWSKFWQIGSRRPHRLTWSGTLGQPTAPK